ncbi:MAG: hypothetical protein L3J22_04015 [Xanthomonadales bacterium]|nr:hypothetical protein [Xanthomonadales bacterium]
MKLSKPLYQLLGLLTITLALGACATTSQDDLVIIPTNSTENIPTLAEGLKLEDSSSEKDNDEG